MTLDTAKFFAAGMFTSSLCKAKGMDAEIINIHRKIICRHNSRFYAAVLHYCSPGRVG